MERDEMLAELDADTVMDMLELIEPMAEVKEYKWVGGADDGGLKVTIVYILSDIEVADYLQVDDADE